MSTLKHRTSAAPEADMATPRTLVERAYLGLRHDVVCGKLAPGERLRVEHLKDTAFAAKCIDNWHQWMKPTTV